MSTVKAVVGGFLVTTGLILAGGWTAGVFFPARIGAAVSAPSLPAALLALVYTGAATVVGAYVATKINESGDTINGFVIAQFFFGFGLIRQFWLTGSNWYALLALLLIIPSALIGHALARRSRQSGTLAPPDVLRP